MEAKKAARRAAMWSAVALAALAGPGLAVADQVSPQFGKGGGHHGQGPGLSLQGRALAQQGEREGYGIEVQAHAPEEGEAGGYVRFGHRTAERAEGFVGEVTCLSRDASGIVQLSGTIHRSAAHEGRKGDGGDKPSEPQGQPDPSAFLDELLGPDQETAPAPAGDGGGGGGGGGDDSDGDGKRRFGRGGGELEGKDFALTIDVPGDPQHFSTARVADAGTLAACSAGDGTSLEVTRGGFRSTTSEGGRHHRQRD